MADWTTCPACGLKHTKRPDGICPRCKTSVDGASEGFQPAPEGQAPTAPSPAAQLGSLSQSARGKELKSARGILLVIGILSAVLNIVLFGLAATTVENAIQAEIAKLPRGYVADPEVVAQVRGTALKSMRLAALGGVLAGGILIACGVLVMKFPVPATITGLVVYIGSNAIFMLLDPSTIGTGVIIKILIVAGLFKAVQAALAHQKEASGAAAF